MGQWRMGVQKYAFVTVAKPVGMPASSTECLGSSPGSTLNLAPAHAHLGRQQVQTQVGPCQPGEDLTHLSDFSLGPVTQCRGDLSVLLS